MKKKKAAEIARLIHDETFDMHPEEIRQFGHHATDVMADYFKKIGDTSILPRIPLQHLRKLIDEPLPQTEQNPRRVLDECQEKIVANVVRIGHPRLLGWIVSSGTVVGSFADGIASALNQNVSISASNAALINRRAPCRRMSVMGSSTNASGFFKSIKLSLVMVCVSFHFDDSKCQAIAAKQSLGGYTTYFLKHNF